MTWLIDANVLIDAGKVGLVERLVAANASQAWCLTQEVFDELGSVPGRAHLMPLIRPSPQLGTQEAKMSAEIVAGGVWGALGVGEASSIAAAFFDSALGFVTWDIKAGWRSLHELRGRTAVGHTWLKGLVFAGVLSESEADLIVKADRTRRHPTWWLAPNP